MSNYTKSTNFTAKDILPSGNSQKIITGTEIDNELIAVASAISSKADSNSPTFTGTPLAPTPDSSSNNTQIATTAFVKSVAAGSTTITGATINNSTIGQTTAAAGAFTTLTADGVAVVTLSATQTLSNKTLSSPTLTGTPTAPTAIAGTNTTQVATTEFVTTAVNSATSATGNIPIGGIIIWSGSTGSIPSGWALCNGSSSTPDLRDRFIVGAGSSYSVGGTGGSANAIVVSHTHSFSATTGSTSTAHTHDTNVLRYSDGTGTDASAANASSVSGKIFAAGATSTYNTVATDGMSANSSHTHSVSGTTGSAGSSGSDANLPPYYALAYIMRIS